MTGELIREEDPPFRLPSGYLVAESTLEHLKLKDGKYVCPRTKKRFGLDEVRKVFFS